MSRLDVFLYFQEHIAIVLSLFAAAGSNIFYCSHFSKFIGKTCCGQGKHFFSIHDLRLRFCRDSDARAPGPKMCWKLEITR